MPALPAPMIIKSGGNTLTNLLILGGGAFLTYKVYKGFKDYVDKQQAAAQLNKDIASTIKPAKGKKLFDLNGKPIQGANLATIAADIENALSYPRDQPRAIRSFKNTPFGYVPELEKFYLQKYGEPLRERMINRLSDENWIKVKFNFK